MWLPHSWAQKNLGGFSLFSLVDGGLADLLQHWIFGWEIKLELGFKICWVAQVFFYLSNCGNLMIKIFTDWQGRKSNDNNIKIFLDHPHYSNNNNWFFPMLVYRLDNLIYFFSPFFLWWKILALLAFLFFTLTNNNITIPSPPPSTSLSTSPSSHRQLMAKALHSRRGGWLPQLIII